MNLVNEKENSFDVDHLVNELKAAALNENAAEKVKTILQEVVTNPEKLATIPSFEDKDVILFEDETVSIWHCRFAVGQTVPAHDHQMVTTVAVYEGIERNEIWLKNEDGDLQKKADVNVSVGDVLQMGPNDIHSVSCGSDIGSQAIHVYLGELTTVERSLFDPQSGEVMGFDDDNYYRLTRSE